MPDPVIEDVIALKREDHGSNFQHSSAPRIIEWDSERTEEEHTIPHEAHVITHSTHVPPQIDQEQDSELVNDQNRSAGRARISRWVEVYDRGPSFDDVSIDPPTA